MEDRDECQEGDCEGSLRYVGTSEWVGRMWECTKCGAEVVDDDTPSFIN